MGRRAKSRFNPRTRVKTWDKDKDTGVVSVKLLPGFAFPADENHPTTRHDRVFDATHKAKSALKKTVDCGCGRCSKR